MAKKPSDKKPSGTETARKIWLAGIGAYGRAFSEAQDAFKGMTEDSSRMFEDLVKKGESLEETVQEKSKEFVQKTRASTDEITGGIDERIKEMRARLSRGVDVADDITDMDKRLTAIEKKLDLILSKLEPAKKPTRKPAAKKTTAKKTAAKKSTKK